MLYDPKWEKQAETKADPFSLDAFASYLETKPSDGIYEFHCVDCAIGGYFKSLGLKLATLGTKSWDDTSGVRRDLPPHFNTVAMAHPHTYGAAAKRARTIAQG